MQRLPDLSKLSTNIDLTTGFTCLDVGANNGQYYTAFKKLFPKSYCLMIEANPHCERRLHRIGGDYKIIGLSDKDGELELLSTVLKPHSKGASFYPEVAIANLPEDQLLRIKVPVTTMDNLFKDQTFDFIKIDVQGSELDILNGGEQTIKNAKYVSLEVSIVEYNIGSPDYKPIVEKMHNLGFFIKDVIEEHKSNSGNIIQLDLLFSNTISAHVLENIEQYTDILEI